MDLSHSGWSDIFFLGMDFPEGARVLNVSVDLDVHGRDAQPQPPIEAYLRVIDEPVLRLVSVDLKARADITALADVFDFAKDYLGLLKAAVIAAGIVPPGLEGSEQQSGRRAGAARRARAWAWKSSARSTTSPRARGWPSPPTCWRPSSPCACGPPGRSQSLTGPLERAGAAAGRPPGPSWASGWAAPAAAGRTPAASGRASS